MKVNGFTHYSHGFLLMLGILIFAAGGCGGGGAGVSDNGGGYGPGFYRGSPGTTAADHNVDTAFEEKGGFTTTAAGGGSSGGFGGGGYGGGTTPAPSTTPGGGSSTPAAPVSITEIPIAGLNSLVFQGNLSATTVKNLSPSSTVGLIIFSSHAPMAKNSFRYSASLSSGGSGSGKNTRQSPLHLTA